MQELKLMEYMEWAALFAKLLVWSLGVAALVKYLCQ